MMTLRWTKADDERLTLISNMRGLTTNQLALATSSSSSAISRRLGQYVSSGICSSTPVIESTNGSWEKDFLIYSKDLKKAKKVCPNLELKAIRRKWLGAMPHKRIVNDAWVSIYAGMSKQNYYSYDIFPYFDYDNADTASPVHVSVEDRTGIADATIIFKSHEGSALFFLEADTGSENITSDLSSRSTFLKKLQLYAKFHDTKGYSQLNPAESFEGFRVLIITISGKRIQNIKSKCISLGSVDFLWFTTLDEIKSKGIFSPIWTTGESKERQTILKAWKESK